jgi:hypothetical protein
MDSGKAGTSDTYTYVRLALLFLALIFLVAAAFMQGEKSMGARFVLTMMGACLLSAAVALFFLEPPA